MLGKATKLKPTAPEDVTSNKFSKGFSFKVGSIQECVSCLWFSKPKHAVVTTSDFNKQFDVPIFVPLHEITSRDSLALYHLNI